MGNSSISYLPIRERTGMNTRPKLPESVDTYDGGWPQTVPEFERLVDAYLDRLVRFAVRKLRNVQDAEDVVQNVLTGVFRDRAKRRGVAAVGPYLYRSVANACTDRLRTKNYADVFREEFDIEAQLMGGENPERPGGGNRRMAPRRTAAGPTAARSSRSRPTACVRRATTQRDRGIGRLFC